MYYVYLLTDPRKNNEVFYCGKGKDNRWKTHQDHCSGNGKDTYTERKVRAIQAEGLQPGVLFLYENIEDEDLAYDLEAEYIRENIDKLTNTRVLRGPPNRKGEAPWNKGKKMPKESVDKGSKTRTGMKKEFKNKQQWKNNISKSLQGEKHPMFGKPAMNKTPIKEITTGKVFDSLTGAAKELNLKQSDISNCLHGRQKSTKGYTFAFYC